jgi:hypothetical protein
MRITFNRLVETGCRTRAELLVRLEFWANRYGFLRTADQRDGFEYARGSQWQALYTFDVRKVPTEVHVRAVDDEYNTCFCTMTTGSWLQISAPNDQKRVSEQMDLLEACLKGLLTAKATAPDTEPDQGRNRGSHDIQESKGQRW